MPPAFIKGGLIFIEKDYIKQFMTAYEQDDKNAIIYLLKNGCTVLKEATPATVLEEGSISKVRIYKGSVGMEVYVDSMFIQLHGKR